MNTDDLRICIEMHLAPYTEDLSQNELDEIVSEIMVDVSAHEQIETQKAVMRKEFQIYRKLLVAYRREAEKFYTSEIGKEITENKVLKKNFSILTDVWTLLLKVFESVLTELDLQPNAMQIRAEIEKKYKAAIHGNG